jgi:hypothetical protein
MSLFTLLLFRYISTYILYPGQQSEVLAHATDFMLGNFCLNYNWSIHSWITKAVIKTLLLRIIKCPEVKLENIVALTLCDVG